MARERDRAERWKKHNFYEILSVPRTASAAEVKKGFRKVAITCHPDKVPEHEREKATAHFQVIAEAYEVLSNATLRQQYDACFPDKKAAKPREPEKPDRMPPEQRRTPTRPSQQPAAHAKPAPEPARPPPTAPPPRRSEPTPRKSEPPTQPRRQESARFSAPSGPSPRQTTSSRPFTSQSSFGGGQFDYSERPRCEGCGDRYPISKLRKCPGKGCGKRLCFSCDLCPTCPFPADGAQDGRYGGGLGADGVAGTTSGPTPRARTFQRPRSPSSRDSSPDLRRSGSSRQSTKGSGAPDGWTCTHENGAEVWRRAPTGDTEGVRRSTSARVDAAKSEPLYRPQPTRRESQSQAKPSPRPRHSFSRTETPADEARHEATTPPDGVLDMLDILVAMGFKESEARAAIAKNKTMDGALEQLMSQSSNRTSTPNSGGNREGGTSVYSSVEGLVGRVGAQFQAWSPFRASTREEELVAQLVEKGFTSKQAAAAVRRCSSIEAAVEWILAHPEAA